ATPWLFAAPWVASSWAWRWDDIPGGEPGLRLLATTILGGLAWKASTRDIDVVFGRTHAGSRVAVVVAAVGAYFSPAWVWVGVAFLNRPFRLWEHHASLPMRVLQAVVAYLGVAGLVPRGAALVGAHSFAGPSPEAFIVFVVSIQASHYLMTGLAKGWLGPRWFSWVTDNRLHHLAASAYSWGWARFWPWSRWRRVVAGLRHAERPLQALAFAVEIGAPLALLDARVAIGLGLAWAGFHFGVFLCSGLLFWEWMLTNLALVGAVFAWGPTVAEDAFGPAALALGTAFMVVFPLRHKLFQPLPLGWFDTPLTQRIHWYVEGESGAIYELYNDFMCPHEGLYGKVNGCFYAPVPVMTYQLGEVWRATLRDAIRAAGPHRDRLDTVRDAFGILPRDEALAARHEAYLSHFFAALAEGRRKHVLPRGLRGLKAPGGQVFHWGERPAYQGQEPAVRVEIRYRETYFDGEALVPIIDVVVRDLCLRTPLPPVQRELTVKELDDVLLPLAVGRLVDLPKFAGDLVRGHDRGKRNR
ncbi:MAG: hypothetical protein AAGN82_31500, partial [Myxococcota bacterium]